jgi:hypothetical protein
VNIGEEILRAESPDEWVAAVLGLLSDGGCRERLGQAARKRVVSDYSWASRMMPLVSLCTALAGTGETAHEAPRQTDRDAARLRHVGGLAEPYQGATP